VSGKRRRSFTREFKLSALRRMAETDNIVALARELNAERKLLYCWRERYAGGGAAALRRAGRPSTAELGSEALEPAAVAVGQQQFALDFFAQPCGRSGRNAVRTAGLAEQHLRGDPRDDAAARQSWDRAAVRPGRGQPGGLLPALAGLGAAPGGDRA
jgi:transposase